jgi:hypothetical protein
MSVKKTDRQATIIPLIKIINLGGNSLSNLQLALLRHSETQGAALHARN